MNRMISIVLVHIVKLHIYFVIPSSLYSPPPPEKTLNSPRLGTTALYSDFYYNEKFNEFNITDKYIILH